MRIEPTVYVVDNDPGVLTSLCWLFESAQLAVKTFSSCAEFLESLEPARPGCIVLDVRMPEMNGLELQDRLADRGVDLPIIFMTGHGDVQTCSRAFKLGAFDFIEKPADDAFLLSRIRQAIAVDAERRRLKATRPEIAARLGELTRREADVMDLIVTGRSQKHIAGELGISIQTVAKHRAKVLEKLSVENDVQLVRLAVLIQGTPV